MINFSISPTPSPASPQQEPNKVMILLISIIFPIAAFVAFLAHGTLFLLRRKNKRAELTSGEIKSQDRDAFSIWNCDGRIAFEEIIRATEDLISDIALELDVTAAFTKHGCLVAEYGSEQGRSAFFKSFQNEAHVLSKIAHRNIVKFYGFCLHKRYMFLICQYMEWGSLFCVLLNDD